MLVVVQLLQLPQGCGMAFNLQLYLFIFGWDFLWPLLFSSLPQIGQCVCSGSQKLPGIKKRFACQRQKDWA